MGENPAYTVTAMIQRSTWLNRYNKNTKMQAYRMFKVHTSSPDSLLRYPGQTRSASNSVKHMKDRTPSHVRNLSVFGEKSATIVKPLHL